MARHCTYTHVAFKASLAHLGGEVTERISKPVEDFTQASAFIDVMSSSYQNRHWHKKPHQSGEEIGVHHVAVHYVGLPFTNEPSQP